jgi:predicted nicotinamide N-methyase
MLPPTGYLPPIKDIQIHPLKSLNDALHYIRRIYNPEVRGSRRRKPSKNTFTELDTLQSDIFERSYAIKWLTALISQLGIEDPDSPDPPYPHQPSKEDLLQNAASLLAICAGTASAGVLVRQFVFENGNEEEEDINLINVELVDVPLDNHDYRSVGAQTWGGACILAEMIVDHPRQFGFHQHHAESSTFRCLELGAGTGLVSITVTKIMMMMQKSIKKNPTELEVVATDYYPSVLANLEKNIHSNFPETSASVRILTRALDWSTFSSQTNHDDPVFESPFDIILGADIIYESQHALWIKSCLTKLLRKPSCAIPSDFSPTFHLVIPLRATHIVESNTIEQVFPLNNHNRSGNTELVIYHKEIRICDAESGREGEDVEYAYYKIGWGSVP